MSLENQPQDENNFYEESESKHSVSKTHRIKKSPKPTKRPQGSTIVDKQQPIFSSLRLSPQFGVFENEVQKQLRLEKFWKQEIDNYYKKNIEENQRQMLHMILEEEVPSLRDIIENSQKILSLGKVPFQELFRYVELIKELRKNGQSLVLVQNADRHYLAVFLDKELTKIIEVSLEEAYLVSQRHKFLANLQQKQFQYNLKNNTDHKLSEISSQIAFLLYLMKQNKLRINFEISKLNERVLNEPQEPIRENEGVEDRYITCLIRKNLKKALVNQDIDYLNYYSNLDAIQQYGCIDPGQETTVKDNREFEEYIKRKKNKKARKNPKGVLKTACGGCLSSYHEQYNPFSYCSDCHIRFHKYCYTAFTDNICQSCSNKKMPTIKPKTLQCQLCPNKGLLSLPSFKSKGVSVHIFCMLVNGLWKFENGSLEFKQNNNEEKGFLEDQCTICSQKVYTYQCNGCKNRAHPLCAYLSGWNMSQDCEQKIVLQCCSAGLEKQKQGHRRKFILNYKKMLFKNDRDR